MNKRQEFNHKLDTLLNITLIEWEAEIKKDKLRSQDAIDQDLKLLVDQRGPRLMVLDKIDKHYEKASQP